MKKSIIYFSLLFLSLAAYSQELRLINQGNTFRFENLQVFEYEDFNDTLVTERFPAYWMDSAQVAAYLISEIQAAENNEDAAREKMILARRQTQEIAAIYDGIFGTAAYANFQTAKLANDIQGDWRLVERTANGQRTATNVTLTGGDILNADTTKGLQPRLPAGFGSYTITDRKTISVNVGAVTAISMSTRDNTTYKGKKGTKTYFLTRR